MTDYHWIAFLDALSTRHDPYENNHANNTVELTLNLAKAFGYPEEDLPHLELGAALHDVGKLLIPEKLLNKKGRLTSEEWAFLHRHVEIGYAAVLRLGAPLIVGTIVYEHHERINGTGYPRYLRGSDISIEARMVAIADTYDALRSPRAYRDPMGHEDAIDLMLVNPGYDPTLMQIFTDMTRGRQ